MNPRIKAVVTLENHELLLNFSNGEQRVFDVKPYLDKGVFKSLHEHQAFFSARVVAGSVEWAGEIGLSYDTLYLDSRPIL
jgi:Protein of unknown function (DUF2442)